MIVILLLILLFFTPVAIRQVNAKSTSSSAILPGISSSAVSAWIDDFINTGKQIEANFWQDSPHIGGATFENAFQSLNLGFLKLTGGISLVQVGQFVAHSAVSAFSFLAGLIHIGAAKQ